MNQSGDRRQGLRPSTMEKRSGSSMSRSTPDRNLTESAKMFINLSAGRPPVSNLTETARTFLSTPGTGYSGESYGSGYSNQYSGISRVSSPSNSAYLFSSPPGYIYKSEIGSGSWSESDYNYNLKVSNLERPSFASFSQYRPRFSDYEEEKMETSNAKRGKMLERPKIQNVEFKTDKVRETEAESDGMSTEEMEELIRILTNAAILLENSPRISKKELPADIPGMIKLSNVTPENEQAFTEEFERLSKLADESEQEYGELEELPDVALGITKEPGVLNEQEKAQLADAEEKLKQGRSFKTKWLLPGGAVGEVLQGVAGFTANVMTKAYVNSLGKQGERNEMLEKIGDVAGPLVGSALSDLISGRVKEAKQILSVGAGAVLSVGSQYAKQSVGLAIGTLLTPFVAAPLVFAGAIVGGVLYGVASSSVISAVQRKIDTAVGVRQENIAPEASSQTPMQAPKQKSAIRKLVEFTAVAGAAAAVIGTGGAALGVGVLTTLITDQIVYLVQNKIADTVLSGGIELGKTLLLNNRVVDKIVDDVMATSAAKKINEMLDKKLIPEGYLPEMLRQTAIENLTWSNLIAMSVRTAVANKAVSLANESAPSLEDVKNLYKNMEDIAKNHGLSVEQVQNIVQDNYKAVSNALSNNIAKLGSLLDSLNQAADQGQGQGQNEQQTFGPQTQSFGPQAQTQAEREAENQRNIENLKNQFRQQLAQDLQDIDKATDEALLEFGSDLQNKIADAKKNLGINFNERSMQSAALLAGTTLLTAGLGNAAGLGNTANILLWLTKTGVDAAISIAKSEHEKNNAMSPEEQFFRQNFRGATQTSKSAINNAIFGNQQTPSVFSAQNIDRVTEAIANAIPQTNAYYAAQEAERLNQLSQQTDIGSRFQYAAERAARAAANAYINGLESVADPLMVKRPDELAVAFLARHFTDGLINTMPQKSNADIASEFLVGTGATYATKAAAEAATKVFDDAFK